MEGSAFLGQPPRTQDDYYIAKGFLRLLGLLGVDAHMGLPVDPPRPPPNRYHFETRGPGMTAGASVSIAIMIFVTVTRLCLRYFRPRLIWGWDDWLIIPGVFFAVTWAVLQIVIIQIGGGGKHSYDVTYHEYYIFKMLGTLNLMVFVVAAGFIKMSITCFNMRITGLTSRGWMIAHRTFLVLLAIYTPLTCLTTALTCRPPRASFSVLAAGKLIDPPTCYSFRQLIQFETAYNVIHILMDFCLLSVPLIVVWKLQMDRMTKFRLYFVFSVGAVSCIAAVLRQVTESRGLPDPTYSYSALANWVLVELTFGVTVASLPVLSALLPAPFNGRGGRGPSGLSNFSPGLPHISTGTQRSSDLGSEGAKELRNKESQEGILRESTVELGFQTAWPLDESGRTGGHGLHANNDVRLSPSPVHTYPTTTYPPPAVQPNSSETRPKFGN